MTRPLLLSACIATLMLASPALAQPSPKDAAAISASNEAATRGPNDASLVGALHEFAYERGDAGGEQERACHCCKSRDQLKAWT